MSCQGDETDALISTDKSGILVTIGSPVDEEDTDNMASKFNSRFQKMHGRQGNDCSMFLSVFMSTRFLVHTILAVCMLMLVFQSYTYITKVSKIKPLPEMVEEEEEETPIIADFRCVPRPGYGTTRNYRANPILCFDYIIPNRALCYRQKPLVLIFVYSAPNDFRRRLGIRNTWGNRKLLTGKTVRVIFPLGVPREVETQQAILDESRRFGDIVQANFYESYKNLSYKGIATIRWITESCPQARYVLKVDSDVFVNMLALVRRLKGELNQWARSLFFACGVKDNAGVIRCSKRPELKSCTNRTTFRSSRYPTYCQGGAYLTNTFTVKALYNAALTTPIWWIDDVFMTGILAEKLSGFQHVKLNNFWERDERKVITELTKNPKELLFGQISNVGHLLKAWKALRHNW